MVKFDADYNSEIARTVSNFNRKVARLQKAGRSHLPSKVSIRTVKSQLSNRRDLNTYLRDLQRFSRRGAENIVTIGGKDYTAYEVDVFKRTLRRERARVDKNLARAILEQNAHPMQHNIYKANLQTRRQALSANWKDIIGSKFGTRLTEEAMKRTQIYDNYLEILFQDAYQLGFEDEKIEYIKNKLLRLNPKDFVSALEDDPNIQYIFEYYHALTRGTSPNENAYDAFQQLYESIDAIVAKYK